MENERIKCKEEPISKLLGLVRSGGYIPVKVDLLDHRVPRLLGDELEHIIFDGRYFPLTIGLGILEQSNELPIGDLKPYLLIGELDAKPLLDTSSAYVYVYGRNNLKKMNDLAEKIKVLFPKKEITLELKLEYNIAPYYYLDFGSGAERSYYEMLRSKSERREE